MFAGLTASDFEAYAPAKWRSNAFTLERVKVKERLLPLGRALALASAFAAAGSELKLEASVDHPALSNHKSVDAQHLFFSRGDEERREIDRVIEKGQSLAAQLDDPTPQRSHLFLALSLLPDRVEAALRLHPDAKIDRQNLEQRCEDVWSREQLAGLIASLPDGFTLAAPGVPSAPAAATTGTVLQAAIAALRAASATMATPGSPPRFLHLARPLPRDAALEGPDAVSAFARASLEALLPLYRFIAWSRDNDHVSMRAVLQDAQRNRRQRGLVARDSVRIVRGTLAGQRGLVQDVDSRGALRILVGKLAVKVDAADVEKLD